MDADNNTKTTGAKNPTSTVVAVADAGPPAHTAASDDAPPNGLTPNLARQLINATGSAKTVEPNENSKTAKAGRRRPPVAGKKHVPGGAEAGSQRQEAPQATGATPPNQAAAGGTEALVTTPPKPRGSRAAALPIEENVGDESLADAQADAPAGDSSQIMAQRLIKALEVARKATTAPVESWQTAWEASYPAPEDHTRLLLAIVGTALAVVLCWGGVSCGTTLTGKAFDFDKASTVTAAVTRGTLRSAYLDDVRAGQEQLAGFWSPALEVSARALAQPITPRPGETKAIVRRARSLAIAQETGASLASATPTSTIDPEFAQFHGSASRYRASTKRSGGAVPTENIPPTGTKPSALGQMLHASLSNQLASNATGTMAKAVLTRKMTVGGRVLPVGAELTGTISGADDTRVFVEFTSVRLADGQVVQMSGKAADGKGRYGLPGRREISRRSVASVGIASSNSMLVEAGQQVGGSIGGIIGRGIAAATSSTADKVSRADRDEYVVLVDRGAIFTVLVEHID